MSRHRHAPSPALLASALLWSWLGLTSCRDQASDRPAPLPLPNLDIATAPRPDTPATDALPEGENRIVCLLSDTRMPFQRAQIQLLQHLDARDGRHQGIIEDAQGDPALQARQLAACQDSPPFALLLQPLDLTACLPALKALRLAGTRIVVLDATETSASAQADDFFQLQCDPRSIGQMAAAHACAALAKRATDRSLSAPQGRILEIRGSDASDWCQLVHEGFVSELHRHPGIVLVHDAPADWDPALAKKRYAEAMRLQSPLDVVFAHDDFLAQAVHQAATQTNAREDLLIIGVNGFPGPEGGLRMLHQQEIDVTLRRPYLVDIAWQMVSAAPDPNPRPPKQVPAEVIRPADLESKALGDYEP